MGNILEIKNLSKKYDDFALDNVNITRRAAVSGLSEKTEREKVQLLN